MLLWARIANSHFEYWNLFIFSQLARIIIQLQMPRQQRWRKRNTKNAYISAIYIFFITLISNAIENKTTHVASCMWMEQIWNVYYIYEWNKFSIQLRSTFPLRPFGLWRSQKWYRRIRTFLVSMPWLNHCDIIAFMTFVLSAFILVLLFFQRNCVNNFGLSSILLVSSQFAVLYFIFFTVFFCFFFCHTIWIENTFLVNSIFVVDKT